MMVVMKKNVKGTKKCVIKRILSLMTIKIAYNKDFKEKRIIYKLKKLTRFDYTVMVIKDYKLLIESYHILMVYVLEK